MTDKELDEVMDNAVVVMGLEAQGHIPTVEKMVADYKSFDAIGRAIGWDGLTVARHYVWYLLRQRESLRTRAEKAEAIATAAHAWRTARLRCLEDNTADNASDYANAKTDLMAALDGARGGSNG